MPINEWIEVFILREGTIITMQEIVKVGLGKYPVKSEDLFPTRTLFVGIKQDTDWIAIFGRKFIFMKHFSKETVFICSTDDFT